MRKWLYILFFVVLVLVVGVVIWLFFFSPKSAPITPGTGNPFGGSGIRKGGLFFGEGDTKSATSSETEVTGAEEQILTHVWEKPVAGYAFANRQIIEEVASTTSTGTSTVLQVRATSTLLLFMDRATGYIYGYNNKSLKTAQISNTLIPGVYEASFFLNGTHVLVRSYDDKEDTIKSFIYKIPPLSFGKDPISLEKVNQLPDNVTSVSVNGNEDEVSFLVGGTSGGVLYTLDKNLNSSSLALPVSDWTIAYGGAYLYLTSKASAYTQGYTTVVPSGARMISQKPGLISLPSSSPGKIFSSMWTQNGQVSFMFDRATGKTTISPIRTLASKCAFENTFPGLLCAVPAIFPRTDSEFPDSWYQGLVSFSDALYRINQTGDDAAFFFNLEKAAGEPIDVYRPFMSRDDSFFVFKNKKDSSLWLMSLDLLIAG